PGNVIGGGTAATANVIAFNRNGIVIEGSTASGNSISANSIFSQQQLGIDLNGDGPTPNDVTDADGGPNGLQNFPEIESAMASRNGATVTGTLNSRPLSRFTVELFVNDARNPLGYGEG